MIRNLNLAKKNREVDSESWENLYENEIVRKIRARYSVDQELAILRKRDSRPEEFARYNAFVEECKALVRKEMQI